MQVWEELVVLSMMETTWELPDEGHPDLTQAIEDLWKQGRMTRLKNIKLKDGSYIWKGMAQPSWLVGT